MEGVGVDHLADERQKARFDVEEMKVVWAGSSHAVEVSDRMARLVASDPVIALEPLSRDGVDVDFFFFNNLA